MMAWVGSVFFGLLQSRGLPLSQGLFGSKGSFSLIGRDFMDSVTVGWKSPSLMIVGVMKISRFCLSIVLTSLRKAYPRIGTSPRIGTLVNLAFGLSLTMPPMTSVLALGMRTWVSIERESNSSAWFTKPPTVLVTVAKKLETWGRTFSQM